MSFEIIVRPGAQKDIEAIFQWYEEKEPGLGDYFILCLDASLARIARSPTAHRIVRHEYRRFFVRKFPVGAFYIVRNTTIYLDVVEPLVRDPARLDKKLNG